MKFVLFLSLLLNFNLAYSDSEVSISLDEYNRLTNGESKGCMGNIFEQTSKGLSSSFESHMNSTNMVLDTAKKFVELEQKCGNELAKEMKVLEAEKLRHDDVVRKLPHQIRLVEIAYKEELLKVTKQCRQTSGAAFLEFKALQSRGVLNEKDGGFNALVGRNENINKFKKLFFDDCYAHEDNIAELQLLKQKLNANLELLGTNVESSKAALANAHQNISVNQGRILASCDNHKQYLEYEEKIKQNQASAAEAVTKKQTLMGLVSAVSTCASFNGNPEATGAGAAAGQ